MIQIYIIYVKYDEETINVDIHMLEKDAVLLYIMNNIYNTIK